MVRRAYKITPEQDAMIARLSREMGVDKEQVVQLALGAGLPAMERLWENAGRPQGLEMFRVALMGGDDGRINKPGAKSAGAKRRS